MSLPKGFGSYHPNDDKKKTKEKREHVIPIKKDTFIAIIFWITFGLTILGGLYVEPAILTVLVLHLLIGGVLVSTDFNLFFTEQKIRFKKHYEP